MNAPRPLPPREARVLRALLEVESLTRAELDARADCVNSPDAVFRLVREWGLPIQSEKEFVTTSAGNRARRGRYWLTGEGRAVARALLAGEPPPPRAEQADLFGGADA